MHARLGILLSGSGSTYANLADHIASGDLPAEICGVVASKAGVGGLDHARHFGHRHIVTANADAVSAFFADCAADYLVMCGWLKFYDPPARWQDRTVNIHPSLLPAFGGAGMYGARVHRAVLAHGCKVSGCTAHLVSGAYDSGPILAQQTVPVLPDDDAASLAARVQAAERELYPRVIHALITGGVAGDGPCRHLPTLPTP
ncbi:MAG: phosphoribosylglycinamide formyltransferase [Planctomycetota bacterium]|jgi:phosphoribosylglycinamide formyltransferase-1